MLALAALLITLSTSPAEGQQRLELLTERARLVAERPGLGLPVLEVLAASNLILPTLATVAAGILSATYNPLGNWGQSSNGQNTSGLAVGIGISLVAIGAIVGLFWHGMSTIRARNAFDARVDELDACLESGAVDDCRARAPCTAARLAEPVH